MDTAEMVRPDVERTIIPRYGCLLRPGVARELVRVLTVDLYANTAAKGGLPLHVARGVRVWDGEPTWWFVTDADARRYGWIA